MKRNIEEIDEPEQSLEKRLKELVTQIADLPLLAQAQVIEALSLRDIKAICSSSREFREICGTDQVRRIVKKKQEEANRVRDKLGVFAMTGSERFADAVLELPDEEIDVVLQTPLRDYWITLCDRADPQSAFYGLCKARGLDQEDARAATMRWWKYVTGT